MKRFLPALLILIVIVFVVIFLGQVKKNPTGPVVVPKGNAIIKPSGDIKSVEVSDSERIAKIQSESYLNILLSIRVFDELNKNNRPLLVAAMRIAGEQNLIKTNEDEGYLEYVPRATIHDIIYELSGITVSEPIGVDDDFYYKYDAEGDYYYVVPTSPDWLSLEEVSSVSYSDKESVYTIKCSAKTNNIEDAENTTYPNVIVKLQYKPNNKYVKYQLTSINIGTAN